MNGELVVYRAPSDEVVVDYPDLELEVGPVIEGGMVLLAFIYKKKKFSLGFQFGDLAHEVSLLAAE